MQLHRTYGGCHADITAVSWAADSEYIAVASRDTTARVFSLNPVPGFEPPTLTGHRAALVAVFFASPETLRAAALEGTPSPTLLSVSSDGALHSYTFLPDEDTDAVDLAVEGSRLGVETPGADVVGGSAGCSERPTQRQKKPFFTPVDTNAAAALPSSAGPAMSRGFARGRWALTAKSFFQQPAPLTAAAYHPVSGVLATAYASGIFLLHQLPAADHIQTLSISREAISSLAFNASGSWLALGCAALGQLLVWEWQSETYVLKQQGHAQAVATIAFSPDGALLVSGADDAKVKLWVVLSGFCFVTFTEHTAAVTATVFAPAGNAVLSASLDGTVRAFDLVRYRNFRTLTTPQAVQFACVAVDPSGEIVCAGSHDTFQIFLWNLRTGQLLDALTGHEGPISGLSFSPATPIVASASWDKSVRLWNAFSGDTAPADVLPHSHDVLATAWHPSGKLLAAATLNGDITIWDALEAVVRGTIEARRDLPAGRRAGDRRASRTLGSGATFTALAFSADGSFLIAAGTTKWVCVYDPEECVLLRRFATTQNLALDGVLDQLNSRHLTDAGPLALLPEDEEVEGAEGGVLPPAAAGGAAGLSQLPGTGGKDPKPAARCNSLALSPSGAAWAVATPEGILLYAIATGARFDPSGLTEEVTVPTFHRLVGRGEHTKAIIIAYRLGDEGLLTHALLRVPPAEVPGVAAALPASAAPTTLRALAEALPRTPHIQFAMRWIRALCEAHGSALRSAPRAEVAPVFRALQQALTGTAKRLAPSVEDSLYRLAYLHVASTVCVGSDAEGQREA